MAKGKKKTVVETPGHDAAVEAVMDPKFADMSNADAVSIALQLQQILRGNQALLENQDKFSEELTKIKKKMAKYDADAEKFQNNQNAFLADVMGRAEKLKVSGAKKEKMIAKASQEFQQAVSSARASQATDKIQFEQLIASQPKVKIISAGVFESGIIQGQPISRLTNEVVRIKHKTWVLPIGQEIEVPQCVADALRDRRKIENETKERQESLSKIQENDKLILETQRINQKYGSNSDMPQSY